MSEFKGTPGPWEIVNGGDIFGPPGGDSGDGVKCDSNDGWQVAEVGIYVTFVDGELMELGDGPREANKHLIAAAPELLEALQAFVSNSSAQTNCPHECEQAEAAIAKALNTDTKGEGHE